MKRLILIGIASLALAACGSETGNSGGGGATDAGGSSDAASGGSDAATGGSDAATGGSDAATGGTDAGGGATDAGGGATDAGGATEVSLEKDVLPILANHCGFCHNDKGKGPAVANKVYYKTKADILGLKGKAYTPGDSAKSGIIGIMKQTFGVGKGKTLMPPPKSGRPKVPDAEIAIVAKWIDQGAKDN